jgi:TetR/AcrR family transcriptional regulator, transcriptional repressor for nem operon
MRAQGVGSTSLDAVLDASQASKSQLYHYFADKDALVLAVIQRQTEYILATHSAQLRSVKSLAGLRRWRNAVVESTRREGCAGGCPLGSLVSELAEVPRSRALLAEGFERWHAEFVVSLESIRDSANSSANIDVSDLATTLLTALQGGLLLAQTTRSTRPLELVLDATIDQIQARLTTGASPVTSRARRAARRSSSDKPKVTRRRGR